jgi:two-component sensor histidine kinase
MAIEMFEAENRADDEIQEQVELQDELVQSAYDHNQATLSLISKCISFQTGESSDDNFLAIGSLKRISALSHLEECLYYYEEGPVVNLKKYADILISEMLRTSLIDPEAIISINEITPRLIPAELASPISIIIFELLENSMLHAFDPQSPVNYIRMVAELTEDPAGSSQSLRITVSDNGIGLAQELEQLISGRSGLAVVMALVDSLDGTLLFSLEKGTAVTVTVPIPASFVF